MLLKIGELAKRTGLTVRTLHHYDAIGLLRPSARSDAGYRLYNGADVARLHRIQALRRLDLPLAEIGRLLDGDGADLQTVIEQQMAALERQLARAALLRDRLGLLLQRVRAEAEPDLPDWLATLELMAVHDRYFSGDDLNTLRHLRQRLGSGRRQGGVALVRAIRALIEQGVPAESVQAGKLALRWRKYVHDSTGGDPRLILKLDRMCRQEPTAQSHSGVDEAWLDYMSAAAAAHRLRVYARYLSAAELAALSSRHGRSGRKWLALFAEVRDSLEQGLPADGAHAQTLCARWLALAQEEWGDAALVAKIQAVHAAEPGLLTGLGMSPEMIAYLDRGIAVRRERCAEGADPAP